MIDILALNVNDAEAIGELVDVLHEHCDVDQCEHFLADLGRWNRLHEQARRNLERSPEWKEIQEWRTFIAEISKLRRAA